MGLRRHTATVDECLLKRLLFNLHREGLISPTQLVEHLLDYELKTKAKSIWKS